MGDIGGERERGGNDVDSVFTYEIIKKFKVKYIKYQMNNYKYSLCRI